MMKSLRAKICYFITVSIIAISAGLSQDCSRFYPFSEGVSGEITNYDKKGKTVAVVNYEVAAISNAGGQETAIIKSDVKDKKGDLIADTSYNIICTGDGISMDFNSLLGPELLEQYQDIEIDVTGTNVELPNNLSAGQSLPDADMNMALDMGGMGMNISVQMIDRKVQGTERVTTPAGTFDCYVITYTSKLKMGLGRTGSAKQWLSEGVGLVKQEDYTKKGKLSGSSVLTAFSR